MWTLLIITLLFHIVSVILHIDDTIPFSKIILDLIRKIMYDKNNIFAQIIAKTTSARIVYEDEELLAFNDIKPVMPTHIIIIPKKEYIDYNDFITNASDKEIKNYFTKIAYIAKTLGLDKDGYRLITNNGLNLGQTIFHFHFHLISGNNITNLI
ncbi:unnamed protein product [Oppiella nova]|uniref:HIT domain-containing protein n=1 Tax=Oppiella nova TaxID=334625 RepID=A0A7R9L9N7_9ACAR|nr:unnamed protein product [Oppiella nova]CAG2161101.1 unnamed protein product [Oppiella nova]